MSSHLENISIKRLNYRQASRSGPIAPNRPLAVHRYERYFTAVLHFDFYALIIHLFLLRELH